MPQGFKVLQGSKVSKGSSVPKGVNPAKKIKKWNKKWKQTTLSRFSRRIPEAARAWKGEPWEVGQKVKRLKQTKLRRYFHPKAPDSRIAWYSERLAIIQELLDMQNLPRGQRGQRCPRGPGRQGRESGYNSDDSVGTNELESLFYTNRSIIAMRDHWNRQVQKLRLASRVSQEAQLSEMVIFWDQNRSHAMKDHPDVRSPWLQNMKIVVHIRCAK